MKKIVLIDIVLFIVFLFFVYVYFNFKISNEVDKIFVTLSTFLFSVFIGFFISKQSSRHTEIRKFISDLDGIMSAIYRSTGHFGKTYQKKVGEIMKKYYKLIIKNNWDYHLIHKSTTITDLHAAVEEAAIKKGTNGINNPALNRIMAGLQDLQKIRKNLISLREERVPAFQWLLIIIIASILVTTISTIPSIGMLLVSTIKAAFVSAVLVAVYLLSQLDSLRLFSGKIGQYSAQDVIDIINEKR